MAHSLSLSLLCLPIWAVLHYLYMYMVALLALRILYVVALVCFVFVPWFFPSCILRHARRQGDIYFPCPADHDQDGQPYPVDPYSATCDDHAYIHTYIHIKRSNSLILIIEQRRQNFPKCAHDYRTLDLEYHAFVIKGDFLLKCVQQNAIPQNLVFT